MALCDCIDRSISTSCPSLAKTMLTIYIGCFSDLTTITYDAADEYIDGITGSTASGYTSGFMFEIVVPFESSNFDVEGLFNKNNNTYLFNPKTTFKISSLDPDTIKIFESLVKAKVFVIVKLQGPTYIALGMENGLVVEAANLTSATASGDFVGATLTLSSYGETKAARELDSSLDIDDYVATL